MFWFETHTIYGPSAPRWIDLGDQAEAARIGRKARTHIAEHFLGDRHLLQYAELLNDLLSQARPNSSAFIGERLGEIRVRLDPHVLPWLVSRSTPALASSARLP